MSLLLCQVFWGMLVFMISTVLHMKLQPFYHQIFDDFELMSLIVLTLTFAFGQRSVVEVSDQPTNPASSLEPIDWLSFSLARS